MHVPGSVVARVAGLALVALPASRLSPAAAVRALHVARCTPPHIRDVARPGRANLIGRTGPGRARRVFQNLPGAAGDEPQHGRLGARLQ